MFTRDELASLQLQDHSVDGRWCHLEVPLHVSFRRWTAVELGVGVDKRQVLALLVREVSHILAIIAQL